MTGSIWDFAREFGESNIAFQSGRTTSRNCARELRLLQGKRANNCDASYFNKTTCEKSGEKNFRRLPRWKGGSERGVGRGRNSERDSRAELAAISFFGFSWRRPSF
jgi:hypothetical protein